MNLTLSIPRLLKALGISVLEASLDQIRVACPSDEQFRAARKLVMRNAHNEIAEALREMEKAGLIMACPACESGVKTEPEDPQKKAPCSACAGIGLVNAPIARVRMVERGES